MPNSTNEAVVGSNITRKLFAPSNGNKISAALAHFLKIIHASQLRHLPGIDINRFLGNLLYAKQVPTDPIQELLTNEQRTSATKNSLNNREQDAFVHTVTHYENSSEQSTIQFTASQNNDTKI